MKCKATWYGGSNFTFPSSEDAKKYSSVKKAVAFFEKKKNDRFVGDDCSMEIFLLNHRGVCSFDYPDYVVRVGPRGATIVEKTG